MFVVTVSIHVKPEHVAAFVEATLDNARHTRQEPGNLRYDVLGHSQDSARFTLYEAYRTADDFAAHQQSEHYFRWKQTVAEWMAEPRSSVKHESLFPPDSDW